MMKTRLPLFFAVAFALAACGGKEATDAVPQPPSLTFTW